MDSDSNQIGKRYFLFLIIFLGALSAFGPFITDFYLPTLPSMTSVFNTSESMVQLGLTTSLVGIAIGQVFFWSDQRQIWQEAYHDNVADIVCGGYVGMYLVADDRGVQRVPFPARIGRIGKYCHVAFSSHGLL